MHVSILWMFVCMFLFCFRRCWTSWMKSISKSGYREIHSVRWTESCKRMKKLHSSELERFRKAPLFSRKTIRRFKRDNFLVCTCQVRVPFYYFKVYSPAVQATFKVQLNNVYYDRESIAVISTSRLMFYHHFTISPAFQFFLHSFPILFCGKEFQSDTPTHTDSETHQLWRSSHAFRKYTNEASVFFHLSGSITPACPGPKWPTSMLWLQEK